jgi:hypothetical protein
MKDVTPAIVIGSIAFVYIHIFNRTMDVYKRSGYTMTWNEYVKEWKTRLNPYRD